MALHRLKALIWIHSAIGAGLVIAFFAAISKDLGWSVPIVGCGIAWFILLGPIEKRAAALTPAERTPATGLPGWVLALMAAGQLAGCAVPGLSHPGWMVVGHLFVAGTLLSRGFISILTDVPMHRGTWGCCLILLTVGLLRQFWIVFWNMMGV